MTNLENLVFFSEKGQEIPMEKTYTITWEIIPNTLVADNFVNNPKGHFLYDLPTDDEQIPNISVIIDDPGKIIRRNTTILFTNDYYNTNIKQQIILDINDIVLLNISSTYEKLINYKNNRFTGEKVPDTKIETESFYNRVKITFNTLSKTYEQYYPIEYVFDNVETTPVESKNVDDETIFTYYKLTSIELATDTNHTSQYNNIILGLIDTNFINYETLFPCVTYMGQIRQDKTSVELVAASTIIIVEPNENDYKRPELDDNQELYFEFQTDSEMKFISEDSINELIWKDYHVIKNKNIEFFTDLHNGSQSIIEGDYNENGEVINNNRPAYFSVGFVADIEGCYQNVMAMYLRNKNNPDKKYLLGLITFLTEVEGEDERFRTLLGNLGIPDPIEYPNLFFSQDPYEEGINWNLVNNKSKELMLTYDEIFPYAGTYKALFGAINFLGYYDLIFKEWYKIKDQNNRDKLITIQTYDLLKNESLIPKLKQTHVNFGDFERYKKLNRLTMIYHLNELNEDTGEYINIYFKRKDSAVNNGPTTSPESGLYKTINPATHYAEFNDEYEEAYSAFFDVPFTTKIYECRTLELLAKLYSVKLWLEKYILGVNCYISDICGEGIIVERLKTQGYVTEHHLQDFSAETHLTPKIKKISEFIDSSALITCSLNEYNTITFEDYKEIPIENFIRKTITINNTNINISNPLNALVLIDEYEYVLENKDTSICSLIEFTDPNYINNPIFIKENKILFFDDTKNISKIDKDELPIIEIIQGNLRYCHGQWENNIKFSINLGLDSDSGNEYYNFYDNEYDNNIYRGPNKIILYPNVKNKINPDDPQSEDFTNFYKLYWVYGENNNSDNNSDNNSENYSVDNYNNLDSEFIYSAHTKWNVPMLIIRNYICGNTKDLLPGDFILEIVEGNIIFRNHKIKIDDGTCVGCNIKFGVEFDTTNQNIYTSFTYMSDRTPVYTFDASALEEDTIGFSSENMTDELISSYLTVNTDLDVKVNRLGDYTLSVKGYNAFNNVFFNQLDKIYSVNATPIKIDMIVNTEHMFNEKDFFNKDKSGYKLTLEEKQKLFTDVSIKASVPIAPQNWRIYDIDPVLDSSNEIIYNKLTYAIDIPSVGDFIIFNNFTEKITYIEQNSNEYKITLLDENPNKDVIRNATNVGLCVYDNIQKEIIADIYPLTVIDTSFKEYAKYRYDLNNTYIKVEELNENIYDENTDLTLSKLAELCNNSSLLDSSSYFINSIQGYIYPADEIILTVNDISVNYNNKETYITDSKQHFIESQVIKICFTNETNLHNQYTTNVIDNETTYRIKHVETIDDNIVYTLDGIFDFYKLNNKIYHNNAEYEQEQNYISRLNVLNKYQIKMCPAHIKAVQYILRVDECSELLINYYNYQTIQQIKVKYANKPLLFENYLDTIYSAYFVEYDPDFLKNIWINPKLIYKETDDLYLYKDFPITINKGQTVILRPDLELKRLTNTFTTYSLTADNEIVSTTYNTPYKTEWNWKSFIIDDQDNWHGHEDLVGKHTIFKSVNDMLTVKAELLGTQDTLMNCIDIYGNLLCNFGEGHIYVKGSENPIVNRAVQETRNIYYKDIYIVGFESSASLTNVLNQQGETTTIVNNGTNNQLYGADNNSNLNPLKVSYKIYYNDGTILENTGADIQLLTSKGNISKTNKVKVKVGKSEYPFKHKCGSVQGLFKILKTNPKDLIKPEIKFNVDIIQNGYVQPISITNLTFNINDIPINGIDELNNDIVNNLITNINYTIIMSNGNISEISGNTLSECNLKLISYTYIDNYYGTINYIPEHENNNKKEIGLLTIKVQYNDTDIITIGNANLIQK